MQGTYQASFYAEVIRLPLDGLPPPLRPCCNAAVLAPAQSDHTYSKRAPEHTRPLCDWKELRAVHDQASSLTISRELLIYTVVYSNDKPRASRGSQSDLHFASAS